MKIVSTFSGCGAMDLGFKKAGFQTLMATDIWEIACESLLKNKISNEVICENVRYLDFKRYKNKVDGVIGGPPCQPYSQTRHYLTKKKKGFDDSMSGYTVPEFLRAIKEISPKFFFF